MFNGLVELTDRLILADVLHLLAGGKGGVWVGSGESHDFAQQQCNKGPPEFSVICVSIMLD